MTESLFLATKLSIPGARPAQVTRFLLLQRLDHVYDRVIGHTRSGSVVLVTGPAGSGKTTLASQWIARRRNHASRPILVVWLSLDKSDNDPLQFQRYLLTALAKLLPEVSAARNIPALLHQLRHEVLPPILVVLDSYQVIESATVRDMVGDMMQTLPPCLHLLILSRMRPGLPPRIAGQFTEICAADLRFSTSETSQFLRGAVGSLLSDEAIATLERRTEGWATGLQLAVHGLRAISGQAQAAEFVASFDGAHPFVADYFAEEVLRPLPSPMQTFLLRTAILDKLDAGLCDALVGIQSGAFYLQKFVQHNLFVTVEDCGAPGQSPVYRYHKLFAQFLRTQLQKTSRGRLAELHGLAANWYEAQGDYTQAVNHLLAARIFERAINLIKRTAGDLLDRGDFETLRRWIDVLPSRMVSARPDLSLIHAWVLIASGQLDKLAYVQIRLYDAERGLLNSEAPDPGLLAAIRAVSAHLRGDASSAAQLYQRAASLHEILSLSLGNAHWLGGDLGAAQMVLEEMTANLAGNLQTALVALAQSGRLQMARGRLHEAAQMFRRVLQLAGEANGGVSLESLEITLRLAHAGMADIQREWNDLDAALQHARAAAESAMRGPVFSYMQIVGYIALSQVLRARRQLEESSEVLGRARALAQQSNDNNLLRMISAYQVRLWLDCGDLTSASDWMRGCGLSADDDPEQRYWMEYLTLGRVLLARRRFDEARVLLARLAEMMLATGWVNSAIESLMLLAIGNKLRGDTLRAMGVLERALTLAESGGYIRTFAEGEGIAMLLKAVRNQQRKQSIAPVHAISSRYFSELIAACAQGAAPRARQGPPTDPLTDREIEIVRLIATGLSNQDIAETLVIAESTVKRHINNIYGKLRVNSRTQAIGAAESLDLL